MAATALQRQLWKQQARYERSRRNIEVINRKHHHLKHQASAYHPI